MSDKKSDESGKVTKKGAVEVDEKDLDQAAGGVLIGLLQPAAKPTESLSLNYTEVKPTYDLSPSTPVLGDGSVKPTDQNWDMKKI